MLFTAGAVKFKFAEVLRSCLLLKAMIHLFLVVKRYMNGMSRERVRVFPMPAVAEYDVFRVLSYSGGTPMEGRVEVDSVYMAPHSESSYHYHEWCEMLLVPLAGRGVVVVEGSEVPMEPGASMIWFDRGVAHKVRTEEASLAFLSIQIPGIKIRAGRND